MEDPVDRMTDEVRNRRLSGTGPDGGAGQRAGEEVWGVARACRTRQLRIEYPDPRATPDRKSTQAPPLSSFRSSARLSPEGGDRAPF